MKKERFEAITDGILAIISTLMIMEIKIPELTSQAMNKFLFQVSIYILSFISIGILWLNHHQMFRKVQIVDNITIWINFFLLFFTSMIPLATNVLDREFFKGESHLFYGIVLGIITLFYTILEERVRKLLSDNEHPNKFTFANWLASILYITAALLSFISPYLSATIFILIPAFYFILPHRLEK